MPGEPHEYLEMATAPLTPETSLLPRWADGTLVTDAEMRDVIALRLYAERLKLKMSPAQLKARRLLRSFLSPRQRRQLRQNRYFYVETPVGHTYRIYPGIGRTERVMRHGKRLYASLWFCLHDDQSIKSESMPPADLSLAHLLMLSHEEDEFLAEANIYRVENSLWDGEWRRTLNRARREREQTEREATQVVEAQL